MKNKRLTQLREAAGLTQSKLANQLGMSQSMIARIEAGQREPRRNNRMALARFFGVSVSWLFYEDDDDHE